MGATFQRSFTLCITPVHPNRRKFRSNQPIRSSLCGDVYAEVLSAMFRICVLDIHVENEPDRCTWFTKRILEVLTITETYSYATSTYEYYVATTEANTQQPIERGKNAEKKMQRKSPQMVIKIWNIVIQPSSERCCTVRRWAERCERRPQLDSRPVNSSWFMGFGTRERQIPASYCLYTTRNHTKQSDYSLVTREWNRKTSLVSRAREMMASRSKTRTQKFRSNQCCRCFYKLFVTEVN